MHLIQLLTHFNIVYNDNVALNFKYVEVLIKLMMMLYICVFKDSFFKTFI